MQISHLDRVLSVLMSDLSWWW